MNTHDIELPKPFMTVYDDVDNVEVGCYSEIQARAAIKAERERILNCIEAEFHIALTKYEDSLDHYWDGVAHAFYKAEQIVKGEIK